MKTLLLFLLALLPLRAYTDISYPSHVVDFEVVTNSDLTITTTLQTEADSLSCCGNLITTHTYPAGAAIPSYNQGDPGMDIVAGDHPRYFIPTVSPHVINWGVNGHPSETPYSNYIPANVTVQVGYLTALRAKFYMCSFEVNYPSVMQLTVPKLKAAGITVLPMLPVLFNPALSAQTNYDNGYALGFSWATYAIAQGYELPYWQLANEIENYSGLVTISGDGSKVSNFSEITPGAYAAIASGLNGAYVGIREAYRSGREHRLTAIQPQILIGATFRHWGLLSIIEQQLGYLPCDLIYWHWYGPNYRLFTQTISDSTSGGFGRSAAACLGDFHKNIWMTEVGRSQNIGGTLYNGSEATDLTGSDQADQASQLRIDIDDIKSVPSVKSIFVYELLDEPQWSVGQRYFGLVTGLNGTQKTAFATFQSETAP